MVLREVRFHGRGGFGAVTASELLASAMMKEGKRVQAFPFFGTERRGAPVQAFLRYGDEHIYVRTFVYNPDHVLVLEPSLLLPTVGDGLREEGSMIVNTQDPPEKVPFKASIKATVDATSIANEILGVTITNAPMLGAFAVATGEVKLDSITEAIAERFKADVATKNQEAAKRGYEETRVLKVAKD